MTVMSPGAMSEEVRTRVVCRIFIKATPEDVWDAICPALRRPGSTVPVTGDDLVPAPARGADRGAEERDVFHLITIGEILEANPRGRLVQAMDYDGHAESVRSALVFIELRDTLTGYTSLTVSCEPDGPPGTLAAVAAGAFEWDRLLGDVKTVVEAAGRDHPVQRPAAPAAAPR